MGDRWLGWSMLGLGVGLLAGSLLVGTLGAQSAKGAGPEAPKPEAGDEDPEAPSHVVTSQPTTTPKPNAGGVAIPNRAAIDAMIDKAGKEPPAWWNAAKLTIPPTLDMSWPQPAPGPWNPNKNISQYYISVINPNPARHQEGCKLMHHIMTVNKDKPVVQQRAMAMLGRIYSVYLQDYARGAFWFRKAAKAGALSGMDSADLAYSYWRLGSREMALAEINGSGQVSTRTIRVLGSMGEVDRALDLAKKIGASYPDDAYLAAGDACRYNGRNADAVTWYQKVLALKAPNPKNAGRLKRYQARATMNIDAMKATENLDLKRVADGTYPGDSVGYRGPVKVEVTVKGGKIGRVRIVESKEDWPLNALVVVPALMVEKQSVQGIDMVSGATLTSEAVINAASKAISSGMKK